MVGIEGMLQSKDILGNAITPPPSEFDKKKRGGEESGEKGKIGEKRGNWQKCFFLPDFVKSCNVFILTT